MRMHNPPHPGEFIVESYMKPFGLSCRYLASQMEAYFFGDGIVMPEQWKAEQGDKPGDA